VRADVERICAIWSDCCERFGRGDDYLLGQPSIADAFYAPVASRLRSYQVALPAAAASYVETIHRWPAFQRWQQGALQEVRK